MKKTNDYHIEEQKNKSEKERITMILIEKIKKEII